MPSHYPFRRLPIYSLAALALVIVAVLGGIYLVRAQAVASARVTHTIEVQVALTEVLEKVRAVESAVRGYVNTRRPEFIEDLALSSRDLSRDLAQVRTLVADNPQQRRNLDRLKTLIDDRIAIGRLSISLMQQDREVEMRALTSGLPGRIVTQRISDHVDAMKGIEHGLLAQRVENVRNAVWMLTGGLLVSLLLILGVAAAIIRDTRRRYLLVEQARDEARLAAATAQAEMTAREEAETRMRQMQMESIGQLTGGIAHDFNNMLAIVIGSLDLAERRIEKDPERARKSIENAREGAQRAAVLTARLLAFSRQQPLAPVPLDANRLVSGMSELLHRTLGEHISVETVLAGGLWTTFADPGQLENALLNLAVNARDAMPEGGRLTIETANGHLDEAYAATRSEVQPGQYVVICVTDTGTGMTAAVADQAFEPFFTTKDVGKGTGLGLSQVFGFVKQSGGHVAIYSEPGEGSTLKLYLPRHIGPALSHHGIVVAAETLPHGQPDEVILVVEDEQRVRHFAVDALRELGYTTLSASNGHAGLELIRQQPSLSLLLTDIVMPGMNGRKLADEAKLVLPDLPVLYTTGYTRNAVVHNGLLDPGVALLPKPFTIAQLAQRVRAMLDGVPAPGA